MLSFFIAEVEIAQELLIDKNQLEELRVEAQKLKSWRKVNKVNTDRLVKLLTVLEKNIRDVLNEDGSLLIPVSADVCFYFINKIKIILRQKMNQMKLIRKL